ncbi:hypothetical protein BS50DRAFT_664524 [Corynespora cassiicola Philippines]|uniref:Uncharacterized protein n=1 Tax=Corynespora cassiicola Philippines TaxID=1448308 RepID=A0A2T2NWP1_CORCC|nr:hypothetical protein BS50DRAFT_664524 [Corynespora cassiicola Philippines]
MHCHLPRELRNKVYEYLWGDKTLRWVALLVERYKDEDLYAEIIHQKLPFFVLPTHVGREFALEVVEMFYSKATRLHPVPARLFYAEEIADLHIELFRDVFQVGFRPFLHARFLTLRIVMNYYFKSSINSLDPNIVRALLSIEQREGFELDLKLVQATFNIRALASFVDLLRPVVQELVNDGAVLTATHVIYYDNSHTIKLEWDIRSALLDSTDFWADRAFSAAALVRRRYGSFNFKHANKQPE